MHKTKNKWYTRAIYLGVALALVAGLTVVAAPPDEAVADPGMVRDAPVHFVAGGDGSADVRWSLQHTHTAADDNSIYLHGPSAANYAAFWLFPTETMTIQTLSTLKFWVYTATTVADFTMEIQIIVDVDGSGRWSAGDYAIQSSPMSLGPVTANTWTELTALNLPGTDTSWYLENHTPADMTWTRSFTTLQGYLTAGTVLAADSQDGASFSVGDGTEPILRIHLGGAVTTWGDEDIWVDDVTVNDTTYELEAHLIPGLGIDVKGSEQKFIINGYINSGTYTDADDDLASWTTAESVTTVVDDSWTVTPGVNSPIVTVEDGGNTDAPYITVSAVVPGDAIIKVKLVDEDLNEFTLDGWRNGEKKWGDIYETQLVPEESTGITAGEVDVDETVIATIHWGSMAPEDERYLAAGGADVFWWLVRDTDANQLELIAMLEDIFGAANVGIAAGGMSGEACGNYEEEDDPWTLLNAWYVTGADAATDTEFVKAEGVAIAATTYTATVTDDSLPPALVRDVERGWTQTTVEFSNVAPTSITEPAIVIVLATYPVNFHGENPVCVEFQKFTPQPVVPVPDVCQVKVPQVRWAGEKIVLEKDWETDLADQLVGFFLEEGCVGNMIPFPGDEGSTVGYIISEDARTAFTVTDAEGVARAMFESEQQGQVDVKCVLYGLNVQDLGGMTFAAIAAQTGNGGELEVVGNHGFLVYYLALEDVAVDTGLSDLIMLDAGEDADVLVKVRGWFTSSALPGTSRPPVDANGDLVYELPAGRYVLPDDWAALAGSDEATSNMASRPQYDLMNTPGDGVDSAAELGPYDSGVRTTTPPGMADDPVIGPFNTLQPWNCVDDAGDPTNMWIADDVVPADYTVAIPITGARTAVDLRNTVVPDTTIDEFDCPMPQALVTFDVDDTEVLSTLDKGTVLGYGIDAAAKFIAPFYAMEIPSHWLIPVGGYRWDSWGLWTASTADDGPYDLWTDLGITPTAVDILEVYSDNHGYAGVTIVGTAEECVTLDVIADFPVMAAKYIAVDTDTEVCWGMEPEHLDADFEVSDRTGEAPITISFYGLKLAGTGAPWTEHGTPPYVKAEWDFDGDGTIDATIEGATSALTLATQTFEFTTANSYSPWLRVTDTDGLVDVCQKPNYIVLTGPAGYAVCDIDESGAVDIADFVLFAASYGLSLGDVGYDGRCDLDASDGVGILDFVIFAQCWAVEA